MESTGIVIFAILRYQRRLLGRNVRFGYMCPEKILIRLRMRSLIRIFTGHILDSQDAQADLGLRCAHMSEGTFSHVEARLSSS